MSVGGLSFSERIKAILESEGSKGRGAVVTDWKNKKQVAPNFTVNNSKDQPITLAMCVEDSTCYNHMNLFTAKLVLAQLQTVIEFAEKLGKPNDEMDLG
jgi:hypothetical protein